MTLPEPHLRITTPLDLVAVVPYLLGFHPDESVVTLIVGADRVQVAICIDLPPAAGDSADPDYRNAVQESTTRIAESGSRALLVGYGPADRVEPAAAVHTEALTAAGLQVSRVLCVEEGRVYWLQEDCTDCPAGATPYDAAASPLPAAATFAGMVALPGRASLAELIAPVTGPERERMTTASNAARGRLATLLPVSSRRRTVPPPVPAEVLTAGVTAVDAALQAAAAGQRLSDDNAAWLSAVLSLLPIRDHAWAACDDSPAQRQLWTDLTRRAEPGLAAAPASLLAMNAYLGGNGALARVALSRALHAEPGYRMAQLLTTALAAGIHPAELRQIHAVATQ